MVRPPPTLYTRNTVYCARKPIRVDGAPVGTTDLLATMSIAIREGWQIISEFVIECDVSCFWKAVDVWVKRPHVLNKRVCVASEIAQTRLEEKEQRWEKTIEHLMNLNLEIQKSEETALNDIKCTLERNGMSVQQETNHEMPYTDTNVHLNCILRCLIPKCDTKYQRLFEFIVKDNSNAMISFIPCGKPTGDVLLVSPCVAYAFQFSPNCSKIRFLVYSSAHAAVEGTNFAWLKTKVFPKICQWVTETSQEPLPNGRAILPSLSLISVTRFSMLYKELKEKYAKYLMQIWTERTDPTKYVYQIISIACYLLVLWEEERKTMKFEAKQSFVDLGCGNGLLTHILSSEGHPGVGIDVKRRKIWDLYGPRTKLSEMPIVPSSRELFPTYDWLIGSHSDELTPWIPVIAARSSHKMKFFLLPCCAHNFDAKFQRRNSKLSIYEDYIEFIQEVAKTCGFETKKDKLRIPSTKRVGYDSYTDQSDDKRGEIGTVREFDQSGKICIIGSHRTFSNDQWPQVDENIRTFIDSQSTAASFSNDKNSANDLHSECTDVWAANFQARPAVQPVRNCTLLSTDLKTSIIKQVSDTLLETSNEEHLISSENGIQKSWRQGGCLELAKVAEGIPAELRQQLKSEFGGLQTLLRNHYHIFEVRKGEVKLQNYSVKIPFPQRRKNGERQRTKLAKLPNVKKACWFYRNHPDGCPLPDHKCFFSHE